jgi:hypothetical protein
MVRGDTHLAIENYENSLVRIPDNENGKRRFETLDNREQKSQPDGPESPLLAESSRMPDDTFNG